MKNINIFDVQFSFVDPWFESADFCHDVISDEGTRTKTTCLKDEKYKTATASHTT